MFFLKKASMYTPLPSNINMFWNLGFVLSFSMMTQILSGILLTFFYKPSWVGSFFETMMLIRNQQWFWVIQFFHANNASLIFFFMFLHIFRGLNMESFYKNIKAWNIGTMMLLLTMMEAFLGYVLPWGQMSLWGATVITNFISAFPYLGEILLVWVRSNFMIEGNSLTRFFSIHFLLPFVILMMILLHLLFLHKEGGMNSMSLSSKMDKIYLHPYFIYKDIFFILMIYIIFFSLIYLAPHMLGDSENFILGNYDKTPEKIQPEWYFLFSYAILRSLPEKLSGILAMILSISILFMMFFKKKENKISFQIIFSMFIIAFFILMKEGGNHASMDTVLASRFFSLMYFYSVLPMFYFF